MREMIERLKKNETVFGELDTEDKQCIRKAGITNCEVRGLHHWSKPLEAGLLNSQTYRICKDYQPEPDTPRFPGYVVVIAGWDSDIEKIIKNYKGIGKQFAGYVFKERIEGIYSYPVAWWKEHSSGNLIASQICQEDIEDGFKPATLGWVVFKEVKE